MLQFLVLLLCIGVVRSVTVDPALKIWYRFEPADFSSVVTTLPSYFTGTLKDSYCPTPVGLLANWATGVSAIDSTAGVICGVASTGATTSFKEGSASMNFVSGHNFVVLPTFQLPSSSSAVTVSFWIKITSLSSGGANGWYNPFLLATAARPTTGGIMSNTGTSLQFEGDNGGFTFWWFKSGSQISSAFDSATTSNIAPPKAKASIT